MARKPRVTIVGPGRLGSALASTLKTEGYRLDEIVTRTATRSQQGVQLASALNATLRTPANANFDADAVWICVPDAAIRQVAHQLANSASWKGKFVFHSSGALTSAELSELKKRGAKVASVHPMMTFVRHATPSLAGVSFAVEGDLSAMRIARRIVKDLGGDVIAISPGKKPLYHAFGAFTSPLLISTLALAERLGQAVGLSPAAAKKAMLPIVTQTLRNYAQHGAAGAFSGPIIRGDADTIRKNLASLRKLPEAQMAYIALARAALRFLPVANRKKLEQVLGTTRSGAPRSGRVAKRGSRGSAR